MKITVAQLRTIIREAVKHAMTDEEADFPGHPRYDNPNISSREAQKLGDGSWAGGYLDEEDLDEEELEEASPKGPGPEKPASKVTQDAQPISRKVLTGGDVIGTRG